MNVIAENIIDSMERRFPTPNPNPSTSLPKRSVSPDLDQKQGAQSFVDNVRVKATELAISMEGSTQRIVVKILDSETKEVIKQIPDEDVLAVAEDLHQRGLGLLNQTA